MRLSKIFVVINTGSGGRAGTPALGEIESADVPFGAVPLGTFNYFARKNGIPLEPAAAAAALCEGTVQPVQVGLVNERLFLVNASLGFYPLLLEDREAFKQQYGRTRWVAMLAALWTLLVRVRPTGLWGLLDMLLYGAVGRLGQAQGVEAFAFREMEVRPLRSGRRPVFLKVGTNGERVRLKLPLVFRVAPRPLRLVRPAAAA